ncbi:hypothetical protein OG894_42600 (plasmid) [Streptomyces sp. NBC_01724]|uniref:hypothetical protein n=1 Tax=Streptomyces sp. NBC_01724 TaxID=2975922 RepID=UPI002E361DEB|nr:hypothetical protein [Streptomyces sp. NBC_01724]
MTSDQAFIETLTILLTAPHLTATARTLAHTHHGWHLYLANRRDEAITAYALALAADPASARGLN